MLIHEDYAKLKKSLLPKKEYIWTVPKLKDCCASSAPVTCFLACYIHLNID